MRAALAAWQGDRFATWRDGERDCVKVTFKADRPDGEAALLSALTKYATSRPGAVAQSDPVRLTACG